MLRVISSTKIMHSRLKIDDYVPFSFRIDEVASMQPLYWRTGDMEKSLLEIGLNENSGAICSVTITLIDPITMLPVNDLVDEGSKVSGVPICDIAHWPSNRFKDEPNPFLTFIGDDKVSIWLGSKKQIATFYDVGNVGFGVDSNDFVSLLEFRYIANADLSRILNTARGNG